MEKPTQYPFFVYGTLLPAQPNFTLWEAAIIAQEPAIFPGGQLHDMGYYPMLVATGHDTNWAQGMVMTIDPAQYEGVQQRLDVLEGYDPNAPEASAYQRKLGEVWLGNGRLQAAWVYLGAASFTQGKPIVPEGNWVKYAAENRSRLEAWWQTIDSVAGLHEILSNE